MAFTPKQERNGVAIGGADHNTAVPGPYPDVPTGQAQSAADVRNNEAASHIHSPQGSGFGGSEVGGYGAMWEWDAGLAINDVEGEGSG